VNCTMVYNKKDVLDGILEIDSKTNDRLTYEQYRKLREDQPSTKTIRKHFGNWNSALEAAGLETTTVSKDDILNDLQEVSSKVDGNMTVKCYKKLSDDSNAATRTIRKKFGTWNEAKKEAGLETVMVGESNRKNINASYFNNIDNTEKAYFLGLIWADGCIDSRDRFSIQLKDRSLIQKFKSATESEHKISIIETQNSAETIYSLSIGRKDFVAGLKQFNLSEKTYSDSLPEFSRKELFNAWLRGFIDGDGYIEWDRSSPMIQINGSTTRMKRLKNKLGFGSIYQRKNRNKQSKLTFYGDNARSIVDRIYPNNKETNPKLERKFPNSY